MRSLFSYICLLSVSVMAVCISGCSGSAQHKLEAATRLLKERPDSAYTILREIDYNDLGADSLKAKYILTKAITNVRVGRSLITDTLLNDACTYFISVGDTANWVIASQLLSGYDYIKGDSESALRRLRDIVPRIKNPELLWDTHIHLLEVSLNSGDYAGAYIYADWLLNHTDVPEHMLKFATAKGATQFMQGNYAEALEEFDSIIASGILGKVHPKVSGEFYSEYAEILDGTGRSASAIAIIDSLNRNNGSVNDVEYVERNISLAQFYANSGNIRMAKALLDSINHDGTQSVTEAYSYIGMLKAALQFKDAGTLPINLMHKMTKTMHRNYMLAQFDRQTAMESVIELNEDNYKLKLQRQRLWLLVSGISLLAVLSGVIVYIVLSRRKQRMIEAEERAETLERMLKETADSEVGDTTSSDSDKLRSALLRQLGIFKTFAGIPTQQSRDALRKISAAGNGGVTIESLVDWPEFYSMIDNLYDGFHARLIKKYPDTFNDKEQQIIVLLKAGFSTKEIGVLTEQSSATIYTRKSVIRKKLAVPENGDIIARIDEQIQAS